MGPELLGSFHADIRDYVERCVDRGQIPDDFAFATEYQREYGRVPGAVIERLINEEALNRRLKGDVTKYDVEN